MFYQLGIEASACACKVRLRLRHKAHAGRRKARKCFVPGDLDRLTFDFDLQIRPSEGQTRHPCEFGTNPFSGSRDI